MQATYAARPDFYAADTFTTLSSAEYAALTPQQAATRNFENAYRCYAKSKGFSPNTQSEHYQQSLRRFSCWNVQVQGFAGYGFFTANIF